MGLIHIDMFTTLDGVAQAPGGPDEDRSDGFEFGGWQAPLFDPAAVGHLQATWEGLDALLLGRRTYDVFAGYWPQHTDGPDGEIGQLFNRVPKYVASRQSRTLDWQHSSVLGPDLVTAVKEVRERHEHVHVFGSLDLTHTLFSEGLFDRLTVWLYPIVLGQGKKLFPDGVVPAHLPLIEPAVSFPKGAVLLRYGASEGTPATGDMSA